MIAATSGFVPVSATPSRECLATEASPASSFLALLIGQTGDPGSAEPPIAPESAAVPSVPSAEARPEPIFSLPSAEPFRDGISQPHASNTDEDDGDSPESSATLPAPTENLAFVPRERAFFAIATQFLPDRATGLAAAPIGTVTGSTLLAPSRDNGAPAGTDKPAIDVDRPAAALSPYPTTAFSAGMQPSVGAADPPESRPVAALTRHLDLARDDGWLDTLSRDIAEFAVHGGRLRFALAPATLGRLDVALSQTSSGLAIGFITTTETARDIITSAQPRIAEEITAQGIRVATFEVSASASSADLSHDRSGSRPPHHAPPIEAAPRRAALSLARHSQSATDGRYA